MKITIFFWQNMVKLNQKQKRKGDFMINPVMGLKIIYLDIDSILPSPNRQRKVFDAGDLSVLSKSIKTYGMLQPVSVRKVGGRYELVAGERRIRAARMAGLDKVPAIVRNMKEEAAASLAIIENTHRKPLTYFDEAESYINIIRRLGLTRNEFAARIGISREYLDDKLGLLSLSEQVKTAMLRNGISEEVAVEIAKTAYEDLQLDAVEVATAGRFGKEQTEKYIKDTIYKMTHKEEILRKQLVKNAEIYVNTINRTIDMMKRAGFKAESLRNENDEYIEYVIKIAK